MALVSASEVAAITGISATSPVMAPAIDTADLLITEEFATTTLSTGRKTKIELYLAAHFATLSDEQGPLAGTKLGDGEDRFHNIYSAGLRATRFGQQAIAFDTTGIF